jgi:hypothetical protein
VHSLHVWSCRTLLGDRLPLAVYVDASTRVRIDPKLRGGAAVHEHRLARLKGHERRLRQCSGMSPEAEGELRSDGGRPPRPVGRTPAAEGREPNRECDGLCLR